MRWSTDGHLATTPLLYSFSVNSTHVRTSNSDTTPPPSLPRLLLIVFVSWMCFLSPLICSVFVLTWPAARKTETRLDPIWPSLVIGADGKPAAVTDGPRLSIHLSFSRMPATRFLLCRDGPVDPAGLTWDRRGTGED